MTGIEPSTEIALSCGNAGSNDAKVCELTGGYAKGVDGVNTRQKPRTTSTRRSMVDTGHDDHVTRLQVMDAVIERQLAVGCLQACQEAEEGVGEGCGLFEGCEVAGVGEHDQVRACYVGAS